MTYCTNIHKAKRWVTIIRAKLHRKLKLRTPPAGLDLVQNLNAVGLHLRAPKGERPASIDADIVKNYLERSYNILGSGWRKWDSESLRNQADIKVPWELARLQHLPQLAWRFYLQPSKEIESEISACIRDFIAENPLDDGVNWTNAMEVSIRAANMIIAYELLVLAESSIPKELSPILVKTVTEHGRYIYRNLEWYSLGRGNHYLADLVGLLFCSAWLPPSAEMEQWAAFAKEELRLEMKRQFLPDGSNFEGSVFYHQLSLEMLVYSEGTFSALGSKYPGLSFEALREELHDLFPRAFQFLEDSSDSANRGIQFGDNDSGSFLKLFPKFYALGGHIVENSLDTQRVLSLQEAFGDSVCTIPEAFLLKSMLKGGSSQLAKVGASQVAMRQPFTLNLQNKREHFFPSTQQTLKLLNFGAYPSFGLYFWKFEHFSVWIRCGKPSHDRHGGHAHFDQLHLDLRIDGKIVSFDPGSYTYTSDIEARNLFRGPRAHFIPRILDEEFDANNAVDVFRYPGLPIGECLVFDRHEFVGRYFSSSKHGIYRRVVFDERGISVTDWADGGKLSSELPEMKFSSFGYGQKISPKELQSL